MGVREALNENQKLTTTIIAFLVVGAVVLVVWQMLGSGQGGNPAGQGSTAFFTIDDGKTWFADDSTKLPPFEHEGKTAYRVYVYTCNGGKDKFASHLERYTPEGKTRFEKAREQGVEDDPAIFEVIAASGIEVKAVGNGDDPRNWVRQSDPNSVRITEVRCPTGKQEDLAPVLP